MTTVALLGAGGKMGMRLSANLQGSRFDTKHFEISKPGIARLKNELGLSPILEDQKEPTLKTADVVILALPDTQIGNVAHDVVPKLKSGAMVVILDAAAPFAGHLPDREDISYFITHPCHPVIFNKELNKKALEDHFGGVAAAQSVVNTLMQGPEEAYALGEEISKTIYKPIKKAYRVTLHQMAMLEPGLSETVCATMLAAMKQAMDMVVEAGVEEECARDFLLGHMNILAAVIFGEVDGQFSDACNKAIDNGLEKLFKPDWKKVFDRDELAHSIQLIT